MSRQHVFSIAIFKTVPRFPVQLANGSVLILVLQTLCSIKQARNVYQSGFTESKRCVWFKQTQTDIVVKSCLKTPRKSRAQRAEKAAS